jgi:hypothetical protein
MNFRGYGYKKPALFCPRVGVSVTLARATERVSLPNQIEIDVMSERPSIEVA